VSISRRDFARTTLIAAVASSVSAAETPAPPNPEAEAKIAWVMGKWGDRVTAQQKKEIRDRIAGGQGGLETMRAYPLGNDVEPATLFRVYRAPSRPQRKVIPHK
jgi:hypothetical protein